MDASTVVRHIEPRIGVVGAQTDEILDELTGKAGSEFWDDVHTIRLRNNEEYFDFTTVPDGHASEYLTQRNRLFIPVPRGQFREFIIDEQVLTRDSLEIYSTGSHLELAKARPIPPGEYVGATVNTMLDEILLGTGWQRGETQYAGTGTITFEEYMSPYAALQKIASHFGLELNFHVKTRGSKVTGRYVDLINRRGEFRGREITSGKDLIDATRIERTENVVSALVGLGPENEDGSRIKVEVTNEVAFQNWSRNGRHLWDIYEPNFSEDRQTEVTEQEVRNLTENELEKRIASVIQYEIDGIDIEYVFGRGHEEIRIGDDLRVKATEFNPAIYLDARIIEISGPISDPSQKTYRLGEFIEYTEEEIYAIRQELLNKIQQKSKIVYSDVPPTNKSALWVDVSYTPSIIKHFDENAGQWIKATPTDATEIKYLNGETVETWKPAEKGADVTGSNTAQDTSHVAGRPSEDIEDKAGAQAKADQAEQDAKAYTDSKLTDYVQATVYDQDISELQAQIDNQITSYFKDYAPSLTNEPASLWTTETERTQHVGDLFFNTTNGYSYRFAYNNGTYEWLLVRDEGITTALAIAQDAQDTADEKRRVFVATPTPPYDIGDLWTKDGAVYRSTANKSASGSYSASDWILVGDITGENTAQDTSNVNGVPATQVTADIQEALDAAAEAQATADSKITSFYQASQPTGGQEGDLWFDTDNGNTVYQLRSGVWTNAQDSQIAVALEQAEDAEALADKKIETYFSSSTPTASSVGDLWYNTAAYTLSRWDGSTWAPISDVTSEHTSKDTETVNGRPASTIEDKAGAQAKADQAEQDANNYTVQYAERKVTKAPTAPASPLTGDLWIDTSLTIPLWKQFNGTTWEKIERTDLSELTGQVVEGQISNGAVDTAKILDGAISEAKVAAGAITEVKLSTNAVTNAKLADLAVTASKLSGSSVTASKIANLAVGTAAIQDAAITNAKIDTIDAGKITTGLLDAARVQIGSGTNFAAGYDPTTKATPTDVQAAETDAKNYADTQASQAEQTAINFAQNLESLNIPDTRDTNELPSWYRENYERKLVHEFKNTAAINAPGVETYGQLTTNVYWGDPSGGPVIQQFLNNGKLYIRKSISDDTAWSAWEESETTQGAQAKANQAETQAKNYTDGQVAPINDRITLWQYADTTYIDGGNIYTNSITANQIAAGTITTSELNADAVTSAKIAANAIQSSHIAANVITSNMISTAGLDAGVITTGVLNADQVTISGTLSAVDIRGATISSNTSINVTTDLYVGNNVYLGSQGDYGSAKTISFNDYSSISSIGSNLDVVTSFLHMDIYSLFDVNNFSASSFGARFKFEGGYMYLQADGSLNVDTPSAEFNGQVDAQYVSSSTHVSAAGDLVGGRVVTDYGDIDFDLTLGGDINISGELVKDTSETGWHAMGGMSVQEGYSGNQVLSGVNFRAKKSYVPSSISMQTVTSNNTIQITELSEHGCTTYLGVGDVTKFYYWRGYYTA